MFRISSGRPLLGSLLRSRVSSLSAVSPASYMARLAGPMRSASTSRTTPLTWNEFLKMRKKLRVINVASSVFTGVVGFALGWTAIANIEIDPTQTIMGVDAYYVYPVGILLSGALGYIALGPPLGDFVFSVLNKSAIKEYTIKNRVFLEHIKKNRPDPTRQSYANPLTDYYGEKIGSTKEYRRWLRDVRAYKKRAENFV